MIVKNTKYLENLAYKDKFYDDIDDSEKENNNKAINRNQI